MQSQEQGFQSVKLKEPRTASCPQSFHPVGQGSTKQPLWALRDKANSYGKAGRHDNSPKTSLLKLNTQSLPKGKPNQINTCVTANT